MIHCCNGEFSTPFFYVLNNTKYLYRRVEFGVCPNCGTKKFVDYKRSGDSSERYKIYCGKDAVNMVKKWEQKIKKQKNGSFSNQNVYYGAFKNAGRKDPNGNIIYLQLRKNFNEQSEVLGEIYTFCKKAVKDSTLLSQMF